MPHSSNLHQTINAAVAHTTSLRIRPSLALPLLIILTLSALTGCSSKDLERDLRRTRASIEDMQRFQAEQTAEIANLSAEVRRLAGRIEHVEHVQKVRFGSNLSALEQDLDTLKQRVPPPAIVPNVALEDDEVLARNLPQEVRIPFSEALASIRAGKFEKAVPLLRNAVDSSAGQKHAANALFWLGVAADGLRDTKGALAAYNAVVTKFPKHYRAPLALLRQASVFIRLRETEAAELSLRKLIKDYPSTTEARRAKERLKDL